MRHKLWTARPDVLTMGIPNPQESSCVVGQPLQINGVLDLAGQVPQPGTTLRVNREVISPDGSVVTPLPAVTPASDGSFDFTDTPAVPGRYLYDVTFSGDSAFYPTDGLTRYIIVEAASG
ncbi:hypothetical protein [Nonomuraea diastatica]|uniref:Ig-like domain repeat protein n=1 Tax=Nonomuraea diastatica TaxID=1848329 RepID=A0A4R4X1S4_9ACTN|nr:hypothetical protein [Nonomuraea diastatica]TDD24139.1 hypothetical protein E1294_06480 [Nonomuraea diastatica]